MLSLTQASAAETAVIVVAWQSGVEETSTALVRDGLSGSVHARRDDGPGMHSAKLLIGAAALAALAAGHARLARPRAEDPDEPEDAEENVSELREQLRRELARLAGADIKASRSRREPTSPPG